MSKFDQTIETTVEQTLSVWAVPHSHYRMAENPEECPYSFEVKTGGHHWEDGAVKVWEQCMEFTVPAGINVTEKAIETFKEAQRQLQLDADEKINNLEERIKGLLQLTHQPELSVVPEAS